MVTAAVRYQDSPVDVASWNFSSACGRLALDADLKTLLAMPYRELALQLPVRMDDGSLRVFRAARVLHSNSRGPAAGLIRIRPGADSNLAFALANFATWTAALLGVPFGGACGVIDCDPAKLTPREYEKLIRRFASRSHIVLGAFQDVAIASDDIEAAYLIDEYSSIREFDPACVVGKSLNLGGIEGFSRTQPRAAVIALRETAKRYGREVQDLRVAILARAETAEEYLREFVSIGCKVVALSDGSNSILNEQGITSSAMECTDEPPNAQRRRTPDSVIGATCDVLVVAGAECSIHSANASKILAGIIVESAPLCITPSADVTLRQQRSIVVPDLLGASGPTIAAHVEWSANLEKKQPTIHDVEAALEKAIPAAVESVFARCERDHSSLRSAAYCIAVERVSRTERLRGI